MSASKDKKAREEAGKLKLMKCVWMMGGLVSYKLCNREYDCDHCSFDGALREKPVSRQAKRTKAEALANGGSGRDRTEIGDDGLGFTHIEGYKLVGALFYHPSHLWARVEEGGKVRIGLDDFAQKLVSRVYSVGLPRVSEEVGSAFFNLRIAHQSGETALSIPIAGAVEKVNEKLMQRPSLINLDPYGQGWMAVVAPQCLSEDLKSLHYGHQVRDWFPKELAKLKSTVETMLNKSRPAVGATLQDGGIEIEELTKIISPAEHRQIIGFFLHAA